MPSPFRLFLILLTPFALAAAGCSSSTPATADGGVPISTTDATIQNQCLLASSSNVCQATACGAKYTNVQDLGCGSAPEYCCAPLGDAAALSDGNIDVGHFPDTGVDAGHHDAGHDATVSDAGHEAGGDAAHDAGHDASSPTDAAHDVAADQEKLDAHGDTHEG